MRVVVQRVRSARVTVDGETTGEVGEGLLVLAGFRETDDDKILRWVARKCSNLRVFRDAQGKMNRSILEVGGRALVVSQFTLYGNAAKGNRPSFIDAAPPELAEALYERFCVFLSEELGAPVATGCFGAMMEVELINSGPVTIWIER